jgi:hypothetical protein
MEEQPLQDKDIADLQDIADLHRLINVYTNSLDRVTKIKNSYTSCDRIQRRIGLSRQIIATLFVRDEIERVRGVADKYHHIDFHREIVDQDTRFKKLSGTIASSVNFTEIRDLIKPSPERWWWHVTYPKNRFDPLLSFFSIMFTTASMALAIDFVPRFFAGGINVWGGFFVVTTPLVSYFFGKEALEKLSQSQAFLEKVMASLNIPSRWRQRMVFILSLLFFLSIYSVYVSKEKVADGYYCSALNQLSGNEKNKQSIILGANEYGKLWKDRNCQATWRSFLPDLAMAKSKLDVAVAMNPSDPDIHFLLGRIYELRQDNDLAKSEYKIAMDSGHQMARIRTALLYLLEEQGKSADFASNIINQAGDFEDEEDEENRQSLYTLSGWARYLQGRYSEADRDLGKAEKLSVKLKPKYDSKEEPQPALFYCIKAAVLEKQKNYVSADRNWNECKKNTNPADPEDDFWKTKQALCSSDDNKKDRLKGKSLCLEKVKKES